MASKNRGMSERETTTPAPRAQRSFSPAIEVFEEDGEICVRADLPGMRREDIRAEVVDGHLILSGERLSDEQRSERGIVRSERRYGAFRRVIALPDGADPESAKASFRDGVLEIRLGATTARGRIH